MLDLKYITAPSNIDESQIRHKTPSRLAVMLSRAKAEALVTKYKNAVIIAADLFVVSSNTILEKPKNKAEAKRMLKSLSGKRFDIITGLAVLNSKDGKILTSSDTCKVEFRKLSEYEIADYVSRYPVEKCAGAFEADGLLRFAQSISGDYNFRSGISVNNLIVFLRKNGVKF